MTHPYKSTTHAETFVHIRHEPKAGDAIQAQTVFLRKEEDGVWYGTDARCVVWDQFDRRIGRQVARRRYFRYPQDRIKFDVLRPKYSELCTAFVE